MASLSLLAASKPISVLHLGRLVPFCGSGLLQIFGARIFLLLVVSDPILHGEVHRLDFPSRPPGPPLRCPGSEEVPHGALPVEALAGLVGVLRLRGSVLVLLSHGLLSAPWGLSPRGLEYLSS